jgi:hypothetical protein
LLLRGSIVLTSGGGSLLWFYIVWQQIALEQEIVWQKQKPIDEQLV